MTYQTRFVVDTSASGWCVLDGAIYRVRSAGVFVPWQERSGRVYSAPDGNKIGVDAC